MSSAAENLIKPVHDQNSAQEEIESVRNENVFSKIVKYFTRRLLQWQTTLSPDESSSSFCHYSVFASLWILSITCNGKEYEWLGRVTSKLFQIINKLSVIVLRAKCFLKDWSTKTMAFGDCRDLGHTRRRAMHCWTPRGQLPHSYRGSSSTIPGSEELWRFFGTDIAPTDPVRPCLKMVKWI